MPRHPTRPSVILALALLALILLPPVHAKALPLGHTNHPAAERPQAAQDLLSQLWSFLATIWSENGSILDPDGASASSEPGGDNGSILDPDGRP